MADARGRDLALGVRPVTATGPAGQPDLPGSQGVRFAHARHIPLPGVFNLRDVGGYPAGDSGAVRWRMLLRSDGLHRLDDSGRAMLARLGLASIIDLRGAAEAAAAPSALDGLGISETHLPLMSDEQISELPPALGEVYDYMIDHCGTSIVAVLRRLAEPGALPALVHCTAGKDRTGVLVALTLAALGVPDHLIADDYALSRGYLYGLTEGGRARIDTAGLPERFAPELLAAPPQLILAVLERARGQVGSIPGYLLAHGLREQELAALREALVERRAPLSPCETRAFG